jgi:hypothetical protein
MAFFKNQFKPFCVEGSPKTNLKIGLVIGTLRYLVIENYFHARNNLWYADYPCCLKKMIEAISNPFWIAKYVYFSILEKQGFALKHPLPLDSFCLNSQKTSLLRQEIIFINLRKNCQVNEKSSI